MVRVLIIEDAADLRLLYRLELELEGYEIIAVGSGNEGAESIVMAGTSGTGCGPCGFCGPMRRISC